MQCDEVIWQIINQQFCSFKAKVAKERTFCQNPYNVSGLCLRSACPLANSRYATIKEEQGDCYLYTKTIERAHTPKKLWEKQKLPSDYTEALAIVSKELEHFPKYLQHRNKQRLTKIHQMLIRMRKLRLEVRPKIVTTNAKVDKREKGKERKALAAAQLDRAIENELLERLKQVSDTEIYNYPEKEYTKALGRAQDAGIKSGEVDEEEEEEEDYEDEEAVFEDEDEDGEPGEYDIEYIEDLDESEDEDEIEEAASIINTANILSKKRKESSSKSDKGKKPKKGARIEIEYEEEDEGASRAREFAHEMF